MERCLPLSTSFGCASRRRAVATVGLTESMLTLLYAVAIGLGLGATAMVARRIGERNPEGAARAAVQAISLGLIVSVIVAIIGVSFADRLLGLMGGSPWVLEHGASFTKIMFAGNATILLLFLINAIFRGAGDAADAMRGLCWPKLQLAWPCSYLIGAFPELGVPVPPSPPQSTRHRSALGISRRIFQAAASTFASTI